MRSDSAVPWYQRAAVFGCVLALFYALTCFAVVYMTPIEYARAAFNGALPKSEVVWLEGQLAREVETILGHAYPQLRIRYWRKDTRSVWVLKEIGKEEYITVGVTVANGAIEDIRVLEYRESRGDEVRHAFFTNQFKGARLTEQKKLTKSIDGITGATLSVRALIKVSKMALLLDKITQQKPG